MAEASGSVSWPSSPHTLRVNQLDARRLDSEISTILRQQFSDVFALMRPGMLELVQPELEAVLQVAFWSCSIRIDEPTPGGRLQNLVYSQGNTLGVSLKKLARWQKFGFLMLYAILPWMSTRLKGASEESELVAGDGSTRARRLLQIFARWYFRSIAPRLDATYAVCAAWNFLFFLRHGVFSTLSDRALGVRMIHIDPMAHRQTEFAYMNRVMLWNGLSEFLMTVLPLVNLARIRRALSRRFFPKASLQDAASNGPGRSCTLCGSSPVTLPMLSDCGHLFCYFCIASEQMENPRKVKCPSCSSRIQSFGPHAVAS